jgi:hypothetical protein
VNETEKLTAAPAELVASAVMSAGTPMFGGVESHGPTVTLNVAEEELPRVSLAEQVTGVVVPAGKVEPELGLQLTGLEPSTRSVAVGSVYVTVAHDEEVAGVLMADGTPLNAGGVVSTTVTVNETAGLTPSLQLTVVGPNENGDPDAGTQV